MHNVLIIDNDKRRLTHKQELVSNTLTTCKVYTATSGKIAKSLFDKYDFHLALIVLEAASEDEMAKMQELHHKYPNTECMLFSSDASKLSYVQTINPYYFFLHPVDDRFLGKKLIEWELIHNRYLPPSNNLRLETDKGLAIIPINRICYIEKINRKVKIITVNKTYLCNKSLRQMLEVLDSNFFHSHQSFIVNMKHIESVESTKERIWRISFKKIEDEILLSRYRSKEFFEIFVDNQYIV